METDRFAADVVYMYRVSLGAPQEREARLTLSPPVRFRLSEYPVERIERATERDIETNLYPILASTDRPTRDAMLEKVQPWLRQWLALEPEETEFHESLNSGVVCGNLLFPSEPTAANAVERHPGLLWKALNAAKKPRS